MLFVVLQAVNSVGQGKTRSRQRRARVGDYHLEMADQDSKMAGEESKMASSGGILVGDGSMCVQFHGDGAVAAQGVIAENFCIGRMDVRDLSFFIGRPFRSVEGLGVFFSSVMGITSPVVEAVSSNRK